MSLRDPHGNELKIIILKKTLVSKQLKSGKWKLYCSLFFVAVVSKEKNSSTHTTQINLSNKWGRNHLKKKNNGINDR